MLKSLKDQGRTHVRILRIRGPPHVYARHSGVYVVDPLIIEEPDGSSVYDNILSEYYLISIGHLGP